MKRLLKGILALLSLIPGAFAGTSITTNSFVRHELVFSAPVLDFAAGEWRPGESMLAVATREEVQVSAIGSNATPIGDRIIYPAAGATGPIAIGDVDGDGANDLVFGAGTNLKVRLNSSLATQSQPAFESSRAFTVGASITARGLALADFDGDGKLDVVYATDSVHVLRNETAAGALSFAPPITIYTNAATFQMGDMDGDGRQDLEISPAPLAATSYLRNTSSPGTIAFARSSAGLTRHILTDINSDAKPDHISIVDLALAFPPDDKPPALQISTNRSSPGTISFAQAITAAVDVPAFQSPSRTRPTVPTFRPGLATGDFNQDGRLDLVWTGWTNRIVFLENLNLAPSQLTSWAPGVEVGTFSYPFQPTVADVNRDGRPDIIVGFGAGPVIAIYENRIEPTPEIVVSIDIGTPAVDIGAIVSLSARTYAADVTAVDFFEDGRFVAGATAANGFRASYQPGREGVHQITARAIAGANVGLTSRPVGLRVRDANVGQLVALGDGVLSQTTLLIYDSGRAFGVGSNARGQLAHLFFDTPNNGFVEIPRPPNAGGWKAMSAGLGFTIGLTTTGKVFSWGINDVGQLGRATGTSTNPIPGEVTFAAAIRKVGAGSNFAIALDEKGEMYGWGANYYGQLGKGDLAERRVPSRIKKPESVMKWTDISVGHGHVLALTDAGELFSWGWNSWGQVGQPREDYAIPGPALVTLPAGETAWTNINAGVVASYAQTASGRTYRWGNYLAPEGEVVDHTPKLLQDPEGSGGFRLVGAGAPINAALGNDRNAYVWGSGILAAIGLGEENNVTNPTRLPLPAGVQSWTTIALAAHRAAALANDGRVFVWGLGFNYPLGPGILGANVPTEICLPMQSCASNYPPAVKIVHPSYGDAYPADNVLRFEIAADDFDGIINFVKLFQQDAVSFLQPATRPVEVARLRFGETTAEVPVPAASLGTSYFAVAYDNNGLVATGSTLRLVFPNRTTGTFVTLTNTAPINELTGWRETLVSFRNSSSFSYGSVSAVLSNVPPGVSIRNNLFPTGAGVETIINKFGVAPAETITFRIEYKLPEDVPGARLSVRFIPGVQAYEPDPTGEIQPLTMTILTNGFRLLEFDHSLSQQHVVQFSTALTNWIAASGFLEERDGKMLWIDGGPPATPKHPAQTPHRFYRVLRKP